MENNLSTEDFESGVAKYKEAEKIVATEFLEGVVALGVLLKEQRDLWKPYGRWLEYVERIGRHISGVNQCIRLAEIAEKDKTALVKSYIDNWMKANWFLSMPSESQKKLGEHIDGKKLDNTEFQEVVKIVTDDSSPALVTSEGELEDSLSMEDEVFNKAISLLRESSLSDPAFLAPKMVETLKNSGTLNDQKSVKRSEALAESFIRLHNAIKIIEDELGKVSDSEAKLWCKLSGGTIKNFLNYLTKWEI